MIQLRQPYLLFLGDVRVKSDAKTAFGLKDWCPERVIGEFALPEASVSLGLEPMTPRAAASRGAGSLVIGIAPAGGELSPLWLDAIELAIEAGLDIVSGMHTRLASSSRLEQAARRCNVRLVDVRHGNPAFPVATGRKRSGKRVLTVGTDCALGKKYTALALTAALKAQGIQASFRATGQTGILITGSGVALDAVIADFVSGAAEQLSPDNASDHWDVIEGQGSLFHPAYAGVTLGLLHGSQPDALVLCHDPSRSSIEGYPDFPIPDLQCAIDAYLQAGRLTNAAIRCIGLSMNSSAMDDQAWSDYAQSMSRSLRLPVVDPMRGGVGALAESLVALC